MRRERGSQRKSSTSVSRVCITKPTGNAITEMPIPEFYARTRTAYAVVRSGERRLYANFLLRKGVIYP